MTKMRILATIKLSGQDGRGKLYLREGDIWCRTPDGEEIACEISSKIKDADEAIDYISQAYAPDLWDLEWVGYR